MKSYNIIIGILLLCLTTCFCLISISCSVKTEESNSRVKEITIIHPGDPKSEPFDLDLIQHLDSNGNPMGYSLWVNSVICRDSKCAIVKVKLNWDSLGRYQSYEVEEGEDLTKLDHVPFTKEDHKKMQAILMDKKSALSEVTKEGLVGNKSQGVDGVSGATVLTLGSNVVLGAGYTCYDLWHWANGEVCEIIRSYSGIDSNDARLAEYLSSKDDQAVQFALRHLNKRKAFSPTILKKVLEAMKDADKDSIPPAINYLKSSQNNEDFVNSLKTLFTQSDSEKRLMLIDSLNSFDTPPLELVKEISNQLNQLKSYQEIHRYLIYVENKSLCNEHLAKNICKLLNHPKFFFSRRAYWFLEKQELTGEIQKKMDAFYKTHEERL